MTTTDPTPAPAAAHDDATGTPDTGTPTPGGPGGPVPAPDDARVAHLAVTSADNLAATIAAAMLDTVGRPDQLPTVLFADLGIPDEHVWAIWRLALAVGWRAGRRAGAPRWEHEQLDRARGQLAEAGWSAMAHVIGRTLPAGAGGRHPADPHPGHPAAAEVRGARP